MIKYAIPSKTFIIGEYLALQGYCAILLTHEPYFEWTYCRSHRLRYHGIMPQSPAGKLLNQYHGHLPYHINFYDPYDGRGGFGASSAQFVGAVMMLQALNLMPKCNNPWDLMPLYWQMATCGAVKPSGYDVIAQMQKKCGLWSCSGMHQAIHPVQWPWDNLGLTLLATGHKQSTHEHLSRVVLSDHDDVLFKSSIYGYHALLSGHAFGFARALSTWQNQLDLRGWLSLKTKPIIQALHHHQAIYAVKGCGAMGSDVLAIFGPRIGTSWIRMVDAI